MNNTALATAMATLSLATLTLLVWLAWTALQMATDLLIQSQAQKIAATVMSGM
jgi:hypothetical protein